MRGEGYDLDVAERKGNGVAVGDKCCGQATTVELALASGNVGIGKGAGTGAGAGASVLEPAELKGLWSGIVAEAASDKPLGCRRTSAGWLSGEKTVEGEGAIDLEIAQIARMRLVVLAECDCADDRGFFELEYDVLLGGVLAG